MYKRQAEWDKARKLQIEVKAEALRADQAKECIFKPKLATQRTPRRRCSESSEKSLADRSSVEDIAHGMHLRRYVLARNEKERATAALQRSSPISRRKTNSSPPITPSSQISTPVAKQPDSTTDTILLRFEEERQEWAREHSKLTTIIELQQRELQHRGIRAEEQLKEIADKLAHSIHDLDSSVAQVEATLHHEFQAIRQLLSHRLPQSLDARLASIEADIHQLKSPL